MAQQEKRPVTMTIKIQHDGFGADITAELFVDEIPGLVKKLRAAGIEPANSPYIWDGKRAAGDTGKTGEHGDDSVAPLCPEHGTKMKRSKFGKGEWYCPKRVGDGEFCKAKVAS